MNLTDGSFLCLDIGSNGVYAVGARVSFGRIKASGAVFFESSDAAYAVKSAVDSLEEQVGARFDSAFVTGNFGDIKAEIFSRRTAWNAEHKITPQDVLEQALCADDAGFTKLHIIPLRYDLGGVHNVSGAVGYTDRALYSVFHSISYPDAGMQRVKSALHAAHLEPEDFFDPAFVLAMATRKNKEALLFIDFGAEYTGVSLWTARGPMLITKIKMGGTDITNRIAERFGLKTAEAERLKISTMTLMPADMDRFTPADAKYDITRFDLIEVASAVFSEIMESIYNASRDAVEKYKPEKIYISGGGSGIRGIEQGVENIFRTPVCNLGADATANALAQFVWFRESARISGYLSRRKRWEKFFGFICAPFRWRVSKRRRKLIPIMPSTLAWNMRSADTYTKFASAGIGMIHVDIMDGFYVEKIAGGIDELKFIRAHTNAHLHVHLMTENPANWAAEAIRAGADTVIVSAGTNGVIRALRDIRATGRRAGIALHPETAPDVIAPVLRDVDEVMVMSVIPGAGGQAFMESAVSRIAALNNTRKRHGLKFKISVDGGISPETAKRCWAAGADFLVAGSFLKNAPDFAAAVQELL
jgi:ribulose-phosphate 3-epimerase